MAICTVARAKEISFVKDEKHKGCQLQYQTSTPPKEPGANPRPGDSSCSGRLASVQLRVLLVDDNPINMRVGKALLTRLGHKAATAQSGTEAFAALRGGRFDLVLLDIQMPLMDGFEICRHIREGESGLENASIPIIALTAHSLEGYREKCLSAGMDDYIAKPVTLATLSTAIQKTLSANSEWLPPMAGEMKAEGLLILNRTEALSKLSSDEELLAELNEIFMETHQATLAQLNSAITDSQVEQARQLLHMLKGTVRTLGGERCADVLKQMENLAEKGMMAELQRWQIKINDELTQLIAAIKQESTKSHEQNLSRPEDK